jgi:hypothetical protein
MKLALNASVLVVAAAIGLGVGFALRAKLPAKTDSSAGSAGGISTSQSNSVRGSNKLARAQFNDDSPLATKLERDLSMSAGVTKWLLWLDAIEKASPADFLRLLRLAQGNPAATRLITDRWIELYPRHVFETFVAASRSYAAPYMSELANRLFQEWPKRDPDAAIAALNGPESVGLSLHWRHSVAAAVIEKDAERGLSLFHDWHLENFGPYMTGVAKWAAADPRHAAEFAMDHPSGYVSQLAMETIGKEWAKIDPARALEFAESRPGKLGFDLAHATLKEWAKNNLTDAAAWLVAADPSTRDGLSASFVEPWGKQDPAAALAWCEQNLSGSSLAQAVAGVVKGAAENDIASAAQLVNSMSPSSARAEAASAVAAKWFPEMSDGKSTKPEALSWLAGLDSESAQRAVSGVAWGWGTSDPKSMASFLASSSEVFPAFTYDLVAREIARKNPLEALDWASRLPENRGLSAGADAFTEWRYSQPADATKWFNNLSASDLRREPYLQSAIRRFAWDGQAPEQIAALAASDPDRALAQKVIATLTLPDERRAKLLDALKEK